MSSFREEVTDAVLSTLQDEGILCANYRLMRESRQEQAKESIYMAIKEKMELNGYLG